jgi:prolyl 4-hydroxylase
MTRTPQVITAELRRWIVDQAEAGCRPQEIIAAMRTAGWDETLAAEALENTLRERLDELDRRTAQAQPASAVPEPDLTP